MKSEPSGRHVRKQETFLSRQDGVLTTWLWVIPLSLLSFWPTDSRTSKDALKVLAASFKEPPKSLGRLAQTELCGAFTKCVVQELIFNKVQ